LAVSESGTRRRSRVLDPSQLHGQRVTRACATILRKRSQFGHNRAHIGCEEETHSFVSKEPR
jgi:hypothetical protein